MKGREKQRHIPAHPAPYKVGGTILVFALFFLKRNKDLIFFYPFGHIHSYE